MSHSRGQVRGGSGGAVSLASPVTGTFWAEGGNQLTILAVHTEGTSATALTLDVAYEYDASTSEAQALNKHLGTSDVTFPVGEESVGSASSGIVPVTITQRRYTFDAALLDGALPVITLPVSPSPCNVKVTFTETASGAGTIAYAVISSTV